MGRQKHPTRTVPVIDFQKGCVKFEQEHELARKARLRREAAERRKRALDRVMVRANEDRIDAVSKAGRLHGAGKLLPIHFDVSFEGDGVSRTERYSLVAALLFDHVAKPGKLLSLWRATALRINRDKSIVPDFVHRIW